MEKIKNSSRNYNGSKTDPTLRLQARPSQKASIFGDDDMSAPTRFQQSSQNRPARRARRVESEEEEDSSDDPLDSLSETSPKKSQKDDRHKRALASQPAAINARSKALKKIGRIPKNKANNTQGGSTTLNQGSTSKKDGSHIRSEPHAKDMFSSPPPPPPPKARRKTVQAAQPSSSSVDKYMSSSPPPAQKSRPLPKPVNKASRTASKTLKPAPFPFGDDTSSRKTARDDDDYDSYSIRPQPYPALSPPRTSSVTPPSGRGERNKPTKAQRYPMDVESTQHTIEKKAQPYPLAVESGSRDPQKASSAKSTATRKPQAFPVAVNCNSRMNTSKSSSTGLSPPSTAKAPSQAKGKGSRNVILTESEEDSDDAHSLRAKAAPFPLSNELLESNDMHPRKKRLSPGSSSSSTSPRKRTKPGDTELEVGDASLVDAYAPVEDSFFETADSSTLCPYCDSPLPPSPSPTLRALLEAMEKKSYADPRPTNLRGRKAPFSAFISLCQRHRFESEILPEAESKGWPSTIDWTRLSQRIKTMKPKLQLLIDDDKEDGPRAKSAAWKEIMQLVKEKGSRAATGIKDQFLNFEKTQPGYYGELGSMIIHQTLYNIFPPSSIDVESVAPLGAEEFLQRVLLPEVALRLIMEDQHLRGASGRKQALQILRDSSAYGVAMFPAEQSAAEPSGRKGNGKGSSNAPAGGSGLSRNTKEGLTAGESIIMERARKRRKEIEEEEAREMEEEEEERARIAEAEEERKEVMKAKPRPRPIARGASKGSLMEVDVNVMSSSKSDADSGRDEMKYDTDPADDGTGSEWKGKGTKRASSRASTTSKRRHNPTSSQSALFSDSDYSSSHTRERKTKPSTSKSRKGVEGTKPPGWSSPETDVIEIEDEDEGFSTNLKTPKAKPFPMEVVEDAPTPKPSHSKHVSATLLQGPDTNLPPLLRARARAEAKEKAKVAEASEKKGEGWMRNMRGDAFEESSGADSDCDRARSGYDSKVKDAGKGKAPAGSLKSRQQRAGSLKSRQQRAGSSNSDDPYAWLLD